MVYSTNHFLIITLLSDIYGRDRATGANASNVDDNGEEIRECDGITPHLNVVPQQLDYAPSSSTNKKKQRQNI